MNQLTLDRIGEMTLENARRNRTFLDQGKSLAELRNQQLGQGGSAIVMASGPSNKRYHPIEPIKSSGFKGALIIPESGIRYLLANGVVPDLIVTADPHPKRMVRWFGDPDLTEEILREDDYFARQDMDEAFANELEVNSEIVQLLEQYGKQLKIAMATSAPKKVVERVLETGMEIYWWNPMLDDPDQEDSMTRELYRINGLPSVNGGGNVGTAAWMMAHAVLNKKHVALTGMDLSYYDGTPYRETQYYDAMLRIVDEKELDPFFTRIYNPYTKTWFFTDPAYLWYREAFLAITEEADCKTYNCTQGGILFGENIEFIPLAQFLETHT
jgi:hypothetical protein